MHRVKSALMAFTLCATMLALLVTAFVIGSNRRCDSLKAEGAASYKITRYCE